MDVEAQMWRIVVVLVVVVENTTMSEDCQMIDLQCKTKDDQTISNFLPKGQLVHCVLRCNLEDDSLSSTPLH